MAVLFPKSVDGALDNMISKHLTSKSGDYAEI